VRLFLCPKSEPAADEPSDPSEPSKQPPLVKLSGMSLDPKTPEEWTSLRQELHAVLDSMLDYHQFRRETPVWRPQPTNVPALALDVPKRPRSLNNLHQEFMREILPYSIGNTHGGFMAYVHGGSTLEGLAASVLATGLDANLGGRHQVPVQIEFLVVAWMAKIMEFPEGSSGVFLTGSSMANFLAVLVARTRCLSPTVRQTGLGNAQLVGYTSPTAHGCVSQAFDLAGLGKASLVMIPTKHNRMDVHALEQQIQKDILEGKMPFFVAGTAGTVDHGQVDPLLDIADVCKRYNLWLHVDGAFGSMLKLSLKHKHLVNGLELADSVALDFHKWLQVPYDCAMFLCRHKQIHYDTFAAHVGYLRRESDGIAGGSPWPCDFGPDLSRSFRAYKAYVTLSAFGTDRLGQMIDTCIDIAHHAESVIGEHAKLQLACPVATNVVAFRYIGTGKTDSELDDLNSQIAVRVQEAGNVAPSTTQIDGRLYVRACIINHRTLESDVDVLVSQVLHFGDLLSQ